jgi:pimeloyl-ACP methyl ester carboxylesterase
MSITRLLLLVSALLLSIACPASPAQQPPASAAIPRYDTLPPMPATVPGSKSAIAAVNGIKLFYTDTGHNSHAVPVILLHGGLANQQYWGNQIRALSPTRRTIAVDSRGHGRSTRDSRPYGYDLMADDVLALMDSLHIPQADLVGWSDGAIISLDLAMRYPARVHRVFSFAANSVTSGLIQDGDKSPNFAHFIQRAGGEYRAISPTPNEYDAFVAQITHMWDDQPHWTDAQLQSIKAPVLIADGDHDEVIRRDHTEYLARTIPGAGLLILPNTSHFAFLQDPTLFNAALLDFLDKP